MTLPDRIWAWKWNRPGNKWHGRPHWSSFEPKINIQTFVSTSSWNPFAGMVEDVDQDVVEYVKAESIKDAFIAGYQAGLEEYPERELRLWLATSAEQAYHEYCVANGVEE